MMRSALIVFAAALAVAACDQGHPLHDAPNGVVDTSTMGQAAPEPTDPVQPAGLGSVAPVASAPEAEVAPPAAEVAAPASQPAGGPIYTPASGSPERTELMDTLRAKVRGDLGGDAVFVVRYLKSDGQWAFAQMEPQWRDGRQIDPATTPLYRRDPDWPFDGLNTEAIWRKVNGRWTVEAHMIGATDVWWVDYCGRVPKGVMNVC